MASAEQFGAQDLLRSLLAEELGFDSVGNHLLITDPARIRSFIGLFAKEVMPGLRDR